MGGSKVAYINQGYLYTYRKNTWGICSLYPEYQEYRINIPHIVNVSTANREMLFVDREGKLYVEFNQIITSITVEGKVDILSTGYDTSLFTTQEGKLYVLYHKSLNIELITLGEKVHQISHGGSHIAVLTENKKLYLAKHPQITKFVPFRDQIIYVQCSQHYVTYVTTNFRAYFDTWDGDSTYIPFDGQALGAVSSYGTSLIMGAGNL